MNLLSLNVDEIVEKGRKGLITVAIHGLDIGGLILSAVFLKAGFMVIGVDRDSGRVIRLNQGILPKPYPSELAPIFRKYVAEEKFRATINHIWASENSDVSIVMIPPEVKKTRSGFDINLKNFLNVVKDVGKGMNAGNLIVIASSVPPGTTIKIVKPILEHLSGLRVEYDFALGFYAEKASEGPSLNSFMSQRHLISGFGAESLRAFYGIFKAVFGENILALEDITLAETMNILFKTYKDVLYAYVNSLVSYMRNIGVNINLVAEYFPEIYGLEIPKPTATAFSPNAFKETYILMKELEKQNMNYEILRSARETNEKIIDKIVELLAEAITKIGKEPKNIRIAILGDAVKENSSDPRGSLTKIIVRELLGAGIRKENIVVHDPFVIEDEELKVKLTVNLNQAVKDADIILTLIPHKVYSEVTVSALKAMSGKEKVVIVDVANILRRDAIPLGLSYVGLGTPWYEA